MRILYVEDNPANVSLVNRVARIGNHSVITYTSGTDALDNFESDKPDIVLMDIQLNGPLNGLEAVQKLRADGHKLPIIAVTAYAMVGDKERCMAAGCDGYLAKPLPVSELVSLFEKYAAQITPPSSPKRKTSTAELEAVFIPKSTEKDQTSEMLPAFPLPPLPTAPAQAEQSTDVQTPAVKPVSETPTEEPISQAAQTPESPPDEAAAQTVKPVPKSDSIPPQPSDSSTNKPES
ncbi:MAG: response regulator [Anaerolineaceae bacterium]|nr:response regulator [Anaerolineaceae bacterium]